MKWVVSHIFYIAIFVSTSKSEEPAIFMTNNTITPSKYAKKAFFISGAIAFILMICQFIFGGFTEECFYLVPFILTVLFTPSVVTLSYIAFLGTRILLKNPKVRRLAYYWYAVPLSFLSVIFSTITGLVAPVLLPHTLSLPACLGIAVFFGVFLILPPYAILLCIIGTIELYIIKRRILRVIRHNNAEEPSLNRIL